MNENMSRNDVPAIVFGSCEQARAVIEGLLHRGYNPVYVYVDEESCTKHDENYLSDALGCRVIRGSIENVHHLEKAFSETRAQAIFLVTTTDLPTDFDQTTGFWEAEEEEFQAIKVFFQTLVKVHEVDYLERHVVMSTRDNVHRIAAEHLKKTGKVLIQPLDDGTSVPHYSGKARGGEFAINLLKTIDGLSITLLTIPFLYSNFYGFFTPLPDDRLTQWSLHGCFGAPDREIDMMGAADLATIVPNILAQSAVTNGQNFRLVGERLSMESIAEEFSNLFGKDVIYNPLTFVEFADLPYPMAPAVAQMCQFHGNSPFSERHDISTTRQLAFPKTPQAFRDWLLTHSDSVAFKEVGLEYDPPEIKVITVFGASSPEGKSVCRGLLEDPNRYFKIKAAVDKKDSVKWKELKAFSNERVEIVYTNFDDKFSIHEALDGSDGAFLVTAFSGKTRADLDSEEQHAKTVIDACESVHSVKHLVMCSMESVEEVGKLLNNGLASLPQFDAKGRAAAYARTKSLSVTYILLPFYSEYFFDLIERKIGPEGKSRHVLHVPLKDDARAMCMSIDDLGPAVANIFSSYTVYAGHEVALVTEFISARDVKNIVDKTFQEDNKDELEIEEMSADSWIQEKESYIRDLGRLFQFMVDTDVVQNRMPLARSLKLIPSARTLDKWVDENRENPAFREKLGIR